MAYDKIEPFGEWRSDLRMAILASVLVNINRSKDSESAKIEDFMPKFEHVEKIPDQAVIKNMLLSLVGRDSS